MTVTVLAVIFIIVVIAIALFGFRLIIANTKSPAELSKERCTICREKIDKSAMAEREIGDYKVLHFCASCIASLQRDISSRN